MQHLRSIPLGLLLTAVLLGGCQSSAQQAISSPQIKQYPASGAGFVQVAPSKRYFQFEDGTPFVIIGANEAMTWPDLDGLYSNTNMKRTEAYLQMLHDHGVNTIRVMAEYSQDGVHNFESPLGTYTPETISYWDQLFQLCEKYDLYVLLTPWDTFWMSKNWDTNPYNAANGGPAQSKHDFLTSPAVRQAQKNRLQFMINRWGNSKHLLAWEILNEADMWWEATPVEIREWVDDMSAYVKATEQQKLGKTHMVTFSTAKAVPDGVLGETVFNHPNIDFANTHLYAEPAVNAPRNAIDAAVSFQQDIRGGQAVMKSPKPFTDTESGPITEWITDHSFDDEYFHNMSWAHLMAGGAGFGMRWPYLEPHTLTETMRTYELAMSKFARTVDWTHFASHNIDDQLSVNREDVRAIGSGDESQAIVWLLQDTSKYTYRDLTPDKIQTFKDATLIVKGLRAGRYEVRFWDTYKGELLSSATVPDDQGSLTIKLPPFSKDLALHILKP
ncbi:hypothetical protein [Tumebacillus permanentifrigoris]|uniref:Mannan endo-1,4-beta-mannosidase n=1 Tax=Tumebacillus permanentifrigoris TaxID=378543 RepID=A0A316D3R7_9BACL|nr:hypothetical protein [Tumebacillus permanentifrigoris]PWK06586.1 mannan endo-1,4-beta-mannosidase [Tumebacillus permanentifrigoris]